MVWFFLAQLYLKKLYLIKLLSTNLWCILLIKFYIVCSEYLMLKIIICAKKKHYLFYLCKEDIIYISIGEKQLLSNIFYMHLSLRSFTDAFFEILYFRRYSFTQIIKVVFLHLIVFIFSINFDHYKYSILLDFSSIKTKM